MKKLRSIFTFCFSLLPILGLLFAQPAAQPVSANAGQGVIAYVLPNDTTGDEIHLLDPETLDDQEIWRTGTSGLTTGPDVGQLAWKPDSSEIAFWSRFQESCSFYMSDIYAIRSDGSGFRRVTAPPACGESRGQPTGTVDVDVVNFSGKGGIFFVYIEGAPGMKSVTLSGSGETTVTFTNVVDFGPSVNQWATAIYVPMDPSDIFSEYRFLSISAYANVIAGQTVTTREPLYLNWSDPHWGFASPTYNSDGSQIAYVFGDNFVYAAPSLHNNYGKYGSYLLKDANNAGVDLPMNPKFMAWGRGDRANQLLYEAYDWNAGSSIFLVDKDSTNAGTLVVSAGGGGGMSIEGLAWLPDSSGFVYSVTEHDGYWDHIWANIWLYDFASQQSYRLTNFPTGLTRNLSVSPDGQKIVFEYQATGTREDMNPQLDLYMIDFNTGEVTFLVENGRSPAWSPTDLPEYSYLYIPLVMK